MGIVTKKITDSKGVFIIFDHLATYQKRKRKKESENATKLQENAKGRYPLGAIRWRFLIPSQLVVMAQHSKMRGMIPS